MSDDLYYVIRSTEDGVRVTELTAAVLKQRLAEGYWGEGECAPQWLSGIGGIVDLQEGRFTFIIKGRIVQPKPVKSWEVP
jgi:hypothetical protein